MGKFDLLKKFNSAVVVLDEQLETVFRNNVFNRFFKDYENIRKFSHKLNYDFVPLDVEDQKSVLSPVLQAFNSKEDFTSFVSYQTSSNDFKYYEMNSTKKGKYTVIILTDVTASVNLNSEIKRNQSLLGKIEHLEDEKKTLSKISTLAQSQAIKLLLLNNISNIIRESIDTSQILNSALKELSGLFGAYRAYYAEPDLNYNFIVKESLDNNINQQISFNRDVYEMIINNKVSCTTCRKEYNEAATLKENIQRIILPIYHRTELIGIIVIATKQKVKLDDTLKVLEDISSQLGSAIIQAELYRKNAEMVNHLTKTLDELKETQLQLINSEKMASIGQLVASVAHEINTPVASIKSNNEIMKKLISKIDNKDIGTLLKEVNEIDTEAISRISGLVVSLRKFVRLDEAELQEADINKELDLTLNLIRHETKNRIEVVKNYGKIPPVKCFPNMLNQVFMNILVNAAHAIKGEGKITIDTKYKSKNLVIKIKDTGCGIKEPEKIFTAGYTTKSYGVGTGMGLAISKKIIEKHRGKIEVKTRINKGSEFCITIPGE